MADEYEPEYADEEFPEQVEEQEEGTAAEPVVADPYELLYKHHPETIVDYAEKIASLIPLQSAPPVEGKDPLHTSQPFLTVFEQAKVLGFRTNQLAQGAPPYVDVPEHVSDCLEIAKLELEQRRLPFIIKRPMPDGSFEYWRLSDLMIL
jgi:DNA-directed RNA polymerase I, II, and III subunit RPABC2